MYASMIFGLGIKRDHLASFSCSLVENKWCPAPISEGSSGCCYDFEIQQSAN
jgi:hypothetical protein